MWSPRLQTTVAANHRLLFEPINIGMLGRRGRRKRRATAGIINKRRIEETDVTVDVDDEQLELVGACNFILCVLHRVFTFSCLVSYCFFFGNNKSYAIVFVIIFCFGRESLRAFEKRIDLGYSSSGESFLPRILCGASLRKKKRQNGANNANISSCAHL